MIEESKKGPDSYWYHYLQTLPDYENDHSIPGFFSEKENEMLKGSHFIKQSIEEINKNTTSDLAIASEKTEGLINEIGTPE